MTDVCILYALVLLDAASETARGGREGYNMVNNSRLPEIHASQRELFDA